eukprot:TRINITY_DN2285_c0_g1_i21.p1 TRINITY_DN2285_c0_g1~~TRINITY_DN2285_c0_g1_i21.p1  ORF type:complete len:170 (-),score=6.43 TRINITY_DN2285_c0_g1_i21:22-531(-)
MNFGSLTIPKIAGRFLRMTNSGDDTYRYCNNQNFAPMFTLHKLHANPAYKQRNFEKLFNSQHKILSLAHTAKFLSPEKILSAQYLSKLNYPLDVGRKYWEATGNSYKGIPLATILNDSITDWSPVMKSTNSFDLHVPLEYRSDYLELSLIHICRCRRYAVCRSRWSPYH